MCAHILLNLLKELRNREEKKQHERLAEHFIAFSQV